jgi:superfamily II DNA or RNA helicase
MNIERMNILQDEWAEKYVASNKRNILFLAPRTGKIACSIKIWEKLHWKDKKILISYPDNKIKQSWENDFIKFNVTNPNIVFTNTSSLHKYTEDYWDMYVIDEAHDLSEQQIEWCKKVCRRSGYVLGLSGTINKESEWSLRNMGLPILLKYSIEDAIKDRIISEYQIFIHSTPLDTKIKKKNSKGKEVSEKQMYDAYTHIIQVKKLCGESFDFLLFRRKALLSNSIAKRQKTLEVIKQLKDKRLLVFTGLKKAAENLSIPFYHSTSDEQPFIDFIEERINQLAMVNIGGIGVTYRNMDAIIMSNFTHNEENTEQTLARSLVMDYKGKIAQLHIITSNEPEELEKLRKTLKNFDKLKIKYV